MEKIEEILKKIEDHLSQLLEDEKRIKADIIKAPELRPDPGVSREFLEHQLVQTEGAIIGVSQVINIIRNGDAYII
ncbi:hypothetical protein [Paenibacillus durus]|nr:hypothetical protein [Paenibacillus durus]